MKHFYYLFSIALLVSSLGFGQTTILSEDFETTPATPELTYTTSSSVTITNNTTGNTPSDPKHVSGSSGLEKSNGTVNITFATVDVSAYTDIDLSFRLASFSGTSGNGADGADEVEVFISTDGGSSYSKEIEIEGNNNARWSFSSGTGIVNETYDGNNVAAIYTPAGGGNRTTDGYSTINLIGLPNSSQLSVRLRLSNNSSSEDWVIDDLLLKGTLGSSGPTINLSESTLSGLNYEEGGGPSSAQSFDISGTDLDNSDVILTAPANFELSDTENGTYDSSIILSAFDGMSNEIWVRLASGKAISTYNGDIAISGGGDTTPPELSLSGEVTEPSCNGSSTTFPFSGVSGNTNLDHDSSGSNPSGSSGESCGTNYRIFYDSTPSTDSGGNYIRSNATDGLIECADWGGTGKFETFSIDVSGETSIAIETFGNTTGAGFNSNTEQFQWWYKLDSGSETNLGSAFGSGSSYTGSLAIEATTINVTGVNNIIVGFTFNMNGGSDGFEDVNVIVTDNLVINGNTTFSTDVSGNVEITGSGSLTLNSNASINGDVVINDGGELTLNGTGTVSGNATITDGGSLIARDGAISGTVTYIRSVPTTNWYLISSPVSGQDIDAFVTASNLATGTQANNVGFSNYNNTLESWTYYQSGASGTGNFNVGQGHAVKLSASGSVSFTGNFNDTNEGLSLTNNTNGFNLIGNPYTSYISVSELIEEDNVATGNEALLSQQTIWLWDQSANTGAGGYVPKNLAADLEIAPGQGFFVLTGSAGTFDITEAMQSHSADTFFTPSSNRPEINLTLTNESETRATDIYYIDGTTTGFDNGYDSSIFGGFENEFAMYTHEVTTDSGRNLGIQSLPDNDYENMIIPVGINATSGMTISISASSVNLPSWH